MGPWRSRKKEEFMSVLDQLIDELGRRANGETNHNDETAFVDDAASSEAIVLVETMLEGARGLRNTEDCGDPGAEVQEPLTPEEESLMDDLERIILPDNNLLPVAFLEEGAETQKAVGRIALKRAHAGLPAGSGWGTGSLVADDLLLTNNHVIPNVAFAKQVKVEFNYQNEIDGTPTTPDTYDLDPDSVFITNAALDYTLVRVKCRRLFLPRLPFRPVISPNGETMFEFVEHQNENDPIALTPDPLNPNPGVIDPGLVVRPPLTTTGLNFRFCMKPGPRWGHLQLPRGRVLLRNGMHLNIVQHPRGRRKEVAVQQNRLDQQFSTRVRYTTDTEPGSSGSPVFNNRWDIIALHHAGGQRNPDGTWRNNQGIPINRIVSDLRTQLAGQAAVRTQLGI